VQYDMTTVRADNLSMELYKASECHIWNSLIWQWIGGDPLNKTAELT